MSLQKIQVGPHSLTSTQNEALILFRRAWELREKAIAYVGHDDEIQVMRGRISPWSFGSTTIVTLKRLGLIVKDGSYYRLNDAALAPERVS